jgi:transcriptional regulator with XRE-family HTH domain
MKRKFGEYLKVKRLSLGWSLRITASILDLSPAYINDIEKGKRNPPGLDLLMRFAETFQLTDHEIEIVIDMASEDRDEIPMDLPEYIKSNELVKEALRKARKKAERESDIVDSAWRAFIKAIDDLE